MTINLDTLRTTVENAGEAWADGEHIDIITPPVVLALLSRLEQADARVKLLESGIVSELVVTSVHSARAIGTTVSGISEALLKMGYAGLSERLEQAEQAVERVREMSAHRKEIRLDYADLIDLDRALDGDGRG